MVWFGKHSVAYVIYVPAAIAGLLVPNAWAFASRAAAQSAAGRVLSLGHAGSQAAEGQNGHIQNGSMQNGTVQNGDLQNGKVEDHAPGASLRGLMATQLQRRRLSDALLGECCALEERSSVSAEASLRETTEAIDVWACMCSICCLIACRTEVLLECT